MRAGSCGSSIAAHSDSAVWREPTSTVRARASPSRAAGRKRSGWGLTAYSSALPWTLTAYGTRSGSPRARISGPITRWLASAMSGHHALGDLRDGRDVAGHVVGDRRIVELGERPRLHALVAVGDVDGQDGPHVGAVGRHAAAVANRADAQRAAVISNT